MRKPPNETLEQRNARLQDQRERTARWRANHPDYKPDRDARIRNQRAYAARKKAADPEAYRLAAIAATARYVAKNPEKVKAAVKRSRQKPERQPKIKASRRAYRSRNIVRMLFNESRARAKVRGVEFTITLADIPPMGTHCPLLGHPFGERVFGTRSHNTPSIDRIDPTKGYVPGNIWVVGYRANLIKNSGTAEEHEMIAAAMRARGVP